MCRASAFFQQLRLAEFVLITIVPAVPLVITNVKMALILTRRRRMWLSSQSSTHMHFIKRYGVNTSEAEKLNENSSGPLLTKLHRDAQREERILTLQLFFVSVTFCILSLPSVIFVGIQVFSEFNGSQYHLNRFLVNGYHISLFSFAVNLTINFVIYCFVGKTFRRAVHALVRCDCAMYRKLRSELITASEATADCIDRSRNHGVVGSRALSNSGLRELFASDS
ncbi:unnamed protein product [Echinostoma caproni]|uniref:G_PROTEIN_RECEP_F1_2 domain-containing protein n=1 Tax=Echinostoma caproni TaxID=27848 RepID=A0A183ALQ6_9TREM|nr:unnamed protein product [Echinostoma caproni]